MNMEFDNCGKTFCRIVGPDGKSSTIAYSPTLQAVLREDRVKKQTGHKPGVPYYHHEREYGPGIGPLRQYEETPDSLKTNITSYNQKQDKSLSYSAWAGV